MRSNLIEIEARLVHQTEKAWLLDTGKHRPTWLPKASCEFDLNPHIAATDLERAEVTA